MKLNQRAAPFRNPLCVALDVDTRDRALTLAEELQDLAGGFKLGPRLLHRFGPQLVSEVARFAPVFVDCKFFDIPSTMTAAVRAVADAGAKVATVHALAGREALKDLAVLEKQIQETQKDFRILAVTILTSWTQETLPGSFKDESVDTHVQRLAQDAIESGLSGIVCSAHELGFLQRELPIGTYFLTPGIRLSLQATQDQKRVMGPLEAIKAGASSLVVGRPIIDAVAPRDAASDYLTAIYE